MNERTKAQWNYLVGERIGLLLGPCFAIALYLGAWRGGRVVALVCAVVLVAAALRRVAKAAIALYALRPWRWERCGRPHCEQPDCTLVCLGVKGHDGSCHADD